MQKKRIFAKYFEVYFNTTSSVARMRKRQEKEVFKERKPRHSISEKTNRDICDIKMENKKKNPIKGWAPPPPHSNVFF